MTMRGELSTDYITAAELNVWRMVATGYTSKEIATKLEIGIKTIDKQRGELFRKLKPGNLAELAVMAVRYGVISVDAVTPLIPAPGHKGKLRYFIPNDNTTQTTP